MVYDAITIILVISFQYGDEKNVSLKEIVGLATMLESCEFVPVWQMLHENPTLIEEATGFVEAVRLCKSFYSMFYFL